MSRPWWVSGRPLLSTKRRIPERGKEAYLELPLQVFQLEPLFSGQLRILNHGLQVDKEAALLLGELQKQVRILEQNAAERALLPSHQLSLPSSLQSLSPPA